MTIDRLGPVGGLAADRPIVSTLVIAFGLTALAVLGAAEAPASAEAIANLILATALVAAAPLMLLALAPRPIALRLVLAALAAGVPIAVQAAPAAQAFVASFAPWPAAAGFAIYAVLLLAIAPVFGAAQRFAFIAAIAALLAMTGALGLFALEGTIDGESAALFAALGFASGSIIGIGAVFDFAALFAKGADRRKASGAAARGAAAPAVFASLVAAGAAAIFAGQADAVSIARTAWLAGAATLLSTSAAFMTASAALALRRSSEMIAVEENRRRERFRRIWRPVRKALAPSAALAIVAIASIGVLAAAFSMSEPPLDSLAFAAAAGAVGGGVFYSIRTGAFIFFSLATGSFLVLWATDSVAPLALSPLDEGAGLALAAVIAAQLAVCWRDARSPRLNARETTQSAMAEAFPRHMLSTFAGAAAFYAASLTGVWPGGTGAAIHAAAISLYMIVLAGPLMTALTHVVRRDLN